MMKIKDITVGVGVTLDMQKFYDDLVLFRKCIDAQIKVLEADVLICTHKETHETPLGHVMCRNPNCGKMISSENGDTQVNGGSK